MKLLSSGQHFSQPMGPSRTGNCHASSLKWTKIELVQDFMHVLVICKIDEYLIKTEVSIGRRHFPHYMSMGPFSCRGNQKFWPDLPKILIQPIPLPNDGTCEIWSRLADWSLRCIFSKVWMTTDDDRRRGRQTSEPCFTISSPCEPSAQVSYKWY